MSPRESRIRKLAQRLYEVTGHTDADANWYFAANLVDAYHSHDFDVIERGCKRFVILTNKSEHEGHAIHLP